MSPTVIQTCLLASLRAEEGCGDHSVEPKEGGRVQGVMQVDPSCNSHSARSTAWECVSERKQPRVARPSTRPMARTASLVATSSWQPLPPHPQPQPDTVATHLLAHLAADLAKTRLAVLALGLQSPVNPGRPP
jgi:hypothetical protein